MRLREMELIQTPQKKNIMGKPEIILKENFCAV